MFRTYLGLALLLFFTNAEDTGKEVEEIQKANEEPKAIPVEYQEENGKALQTGKSFSANGPYNNQLGLGNGYGYIPPQGQFYPIPGPYQPYPYFGGPNVYQGQIPPYFGGPNYLQTYDWLYSRRSNNM